MDRNFVLFIALSFAVLALWNVYIQSTERPPVPARETPVDSGAPPAAGGATGPAPGDAAQPIGGPGGPESAAASPPSAAAGPVPTLPEERVTISTGLFDAVFSSRGGALLRWELRGYDDPSRPGRSPVDIATPSSRYPLSLATPLRGLGHGNLSALDYRVEQPTPCPSGGAARDELRSAEGSQAETCTLVFHREVLGIHIRKTYIFDLQRYLFRLRIEIENGSARSLRPSFNTIWPARSRESDDFSEFTLAAHQDGDNEVFVVVPPSGFLFGGGGSDEPLQIAGDVDWAGAHTRYFLAALLPDNPREAVVAFNPVEVEREALLQLRFREAEIPPGGRLDREFRVYLGPKEAERLERPDLAAAHLDEAVLKGWFPALTRFFNWALTASYALVPNYGVAILIITLFVRLLMAPLMARQMKSMKKLSVLQPRIKEVQARYPNDRQKQSEAMMSVYREAGMSPFSMFSGCLPMLLQLPVFIGFYYALQGSIHLRQQPFFGWIDDLSQPEALFTIPGLDLPVRVLPLLMGGSMALQQKLTPTAMEPAQARMMLIVMPIMFTVLFYQFASGLVLYWFTSTLIGLGQQLITNRMR
ncbi:MAG: membrane protein insertase YidC [Deltaproteobacteria bacterium]|nr:membrane protein insertase YidC [Deltaproteobacteria bacterium]